MSRHTGYELSRRWFDFCFENPDKIRPVHTAVYMFAVEHWNRMGQPDKIVFATGMTMNAVGIKSYSTYSPVFEDLVEWGFFHVIERSKNQYSSNIISFQKMDKTKDHSLDNAMIKRIEKEKSASSKIDKAPVKAPAKAPVNAGANATLNATGVNINKETKNKEPRTSEQERSDFLADLQAIDEGENSEIVEQAIELYEYHIECLDRNEILHTMSKYRDQEIREYRDMLASEELDFQTIKHILTVVFIENRDWDKNAFWQSTITKAQTLRNNYHGIINQYRTRSQEGKAERSINEAIEFANEFREDFNP